MTNFDSSIVYVLFEFLISVIAVHMLISFFFFDRIGKPYFLTVQVSLLIMPKF